eukprot:151644_1
MGNDASKHKHAGNDQQKSNKVTDSTIANDEQKMQKYSDDELDCFEEVIVHDDGDKREPITESSQNNQYIIKCIGQLQVDYKYINHKYEQTGCSFGTATVFKAQKDKCFVISTAHNIRKKIKECKQCNVYMDNEQDIMKCIQCGNDKLRCNIISATSIQFRRREIKQRLEIYDKDEKQTAHLTTPDTAKYLVWR